MNCIHIKENRETRRIYKQLLRIISAIFFSMKIQTWAYLKFKFINSNSIILNLD